MKKLLASALVTVLLLSSCTSMNFESSSREPITLSSVDKTQYQVVGHFRDEVRVFFTLGGLLTLNQPEVDKITQRYVNQYGGDGVSNLTIRTEAGVWDYLVSLGVGLGTGLVLSANADYYDSSAAFTAGVSIGSFFLSSRTAILEGNVISKK